MEMTYEQAQQMITLLNQILQKLNQIEKETDYLRYRV